MDVNGGFTKEFGISNLIKNITVIDAIEYLIENSIDAAEKSMKENINKKYIIDIQLNQEQLLVRDNCFGMDIEEAKMNLLTINKKKYLQDKWGEGLKKSIFVLGRYVEITSTKSDKFRLNINIGDKDEEKLWTPEFKRLMKDKRDPVGFSVKISRFTDNFRKYLKKYKSYDLIKKRICNKYREIIKDGRINIIFQGHKLKPLYIEAKKVYEGEEKLIDGLKVRINLYNDIKDTHNNGVDFIVNNRVIVEKEKSNNISWFKSIRAKGHSYSKFYAEVFVISDDIEKIGVGPSHNYIDFSNDYFKKIINFLHEEIEFNREFYKKSMITVQLEVPLDDLNKWKDVLAKYEPRIEYAKDVIEKLYMKGVSILLEEDKDSN